MRHEESTELGELLGTKRTDRLLDQVVEQLLYKGRVRFATCASDTRPDPELR